jgi:hypothetical protein
MLISERVSTIAVPISKLQTTVPTFLQILVHKQPAARSMRQDLKLCWLDYTRKICKQMLSFFNASSWIRACWRTEQYGRPEKNQHCSVEHQHPSAMGGVGTGSLTVSARDAD